MKFFKIQFLKKNWKQVLFILFFAFSLYSSYLIFLVSARINWDNSLIMLAEQFNRRHIAIPASTNLPLGDLVDYYHNFYLYFGPLPSIVLMPFVFVFGKNTPQIIIGIASMIISFLAVFSISKSFKFNRIDSLWLALFFVFSTILFSAGLINITAYQVEVMGVPLMFFALNEYFHNKRYFLIGIFLALAVLTRFTLVLAVTFFIIEYLQKRIPVKNLILLLIPVFIACILLGLYNNRRFHSIWETGYNYSITLNAFPLSQNLKHGTTSLTHIPANLYSFLIMPPAPLLTDTGGFTLKFPYLKANPWGMAIWFTSPLFLFLIFKFKKNKYFLSALCASIVLAIPVFTYYSVGFAQFGYRYALDFLPFLFLLLIPSLNSKLGKKEITLIAIGIIFNAIYITSLWEVYPLLGIYH